MLKDFNGTELSIIAIFIAAVLSLLNFFVPSFLKDKEKQLDKKAENSDLTSIKNEVDAVKKKVDGIPAEIEVKLNNYEQSRIKYRDLKEQFLRTWTSGEIVKAIKEVASNITDNVNKVSENLQRQVREMETRIRQENDKNFQQYKEYHHGRIEQMQATVNYALQALERADGLNNTVDQMQHLLKEFKEIVRKK